MALRKAGWKRRFTWPSPKISDTALLLLFVMFSLHMKYNITAADAMGN